MTPTIRIDHEVYEKLQEQAKPFVDTPNAVLRRLLELPEAGEPQRGPRRGDSMRGHGRGHGGERGGQRGPRRNRLSLLVETGALNAGDKLVWRRPRSGEEFAATITDDAQIRLEDGTLHDSPSGAGKALNGYDANGWTNWRIERTGESLRDALLALRGEGRGPKRGPSRATSHGASRGRGESGRSRSTRRGSRSPEPRDYGGSPADAEENPPSSEHDES